MKYLAIARQALERDNNTPSEKIYARVCEESELEKVEQEMEHELADSFGVEIYAEKIENLKEAKLMLEIW